MNLNGVPIVGQSATVIPAQMRLDASEMVGKTLESLKGLGLRYGRIGLPSPIEICSAQYLLGLEALEAAGCRVVSICEHILPGPGGQPILMANVVFRVPESLFSGGVQA